MKAGKLIDTALQEPNSQIVVQLPNGQRIATRDVFFHDTDKRGGEIIVLVAGKQISKA